MIGAISCVSFTDTTFDDFANGLNTAQNFVVPALCGI